MKKALSLLIALLLSFALVSCGAPESVNTPTELPVATESPITTESPIVTDAFLQELSGTYEELFPVLTDGKYNDYWLELVTSFVGQENAEVTAEYMKTACTAEIYGAEAIEAYTNPESARFNCYFINGIDRLTFNGNVISGTLDGKTVFSYSYTYQEDNSMSGMMDVRVYKADAENAGEFTYFLLCPDTPDSTYHIEFRYGSDLDALLDLRDGSYAYWLAAGIPIDSSEAFIKSCIELFVGENLGAGEEAEASALADYTNPFLGKWQSEIPSANTTLIFDYKPDGTFDYEMSGVPAEEGGVGSGAYLVVDNVLVSYLSFEGAGSYTWEVIDNETISVTEFVLDETGQKIFGNTTDFRRVEGSEVAADEPTLIPDTVLTANKWAVNIPEGTDPYNTSYPSTWEFSSDGKVVITFLGMGEMLGFDSVDAPYTFAWTVYEDVLVAYTSTDEGSEIKQLHFIQEDNGNLTVTGFNGDTEMPVEFVPAQ
jgi:hypothetical protein